MEANEFINDVKTIRIPVTMSKTKGMNKVSSDIDRANEVSTWDRR